MKYLSYEGLKYLYGKITARLDLKVDKVEGKQLSTNDYTDGEKDVVADVNSKKHSHSNMGVIDNLTQEMLNKLNGIASGAEVNVQSDWNVTNVSSDAYIKNKPTSLPASDVKAWAKADNKPSYSWTEITNKPTTFAPATHNHSGGQITQDATHRFVSDFEKSKWNEIESVKESLEKYASMTVVGEILNLPGGGDIAVTGEVLTIPLRI